MSQQWISSTNLSHRVFVRSEWWVHLGSKVIFMQAGTLEERTDVDKHRERGSNIVEMVTHLHSDVVDISLYSGVPELRCTHCQHMKLKCVKFVVYFYTPSNTRPNTR
jgi:hypothetical protein